MNVMSVGESVAPIQILMIEDSADDIEFTVEAFREAKFRINLNVVQDGVEAMAFLRKEGKYADTPRPDLILLDLKLPKKNGREVLAEIREDEKLTRLPVVILTSSHAEEDVLKSYELHANCYITKPLDLAGFTTVVKAIEDFWFTVVRLPTK